MTTTPATRPADHRVTLAQVGSVTLYSVGAREYVHDDPNGMVSFRYGSNRGNYRRVVITLAADDTYTVQVGHVHRRTLDWVVDDTATGVHAEQLAETVRRLADR